MPGPLLPIAALGLLTGAAAAAELVTADAGAPLCTDMAALQPFVAARANGDAATMAALKGCELIGGGLRVDVLHDYRGLGGKIHLLQVRVYRGDGTLLGFMYGNGLVVR